MRNDTWNQLIFEVLSSQVVDLESHEPRNNLPFHLETHKVKILEECKGGSAKCGNAMERKW